MKRLALIGLVLFPVSAWSATPQSTCYGTTANGHLEHGVKLPDEGKNFVSYSGLAATLGRTYVHSTARAIVLDAYHALETSQPDTVFKYAETGFREGGPFKPHKTHQNGLSIDFMVPVLDRNGKSVQLPTHPFNKYGYNIEFNDKGEYGDYRIDFEAMAGHIVALHKAAEKHDAKVWRVIFDPTLQPQLMQTSHSAYLKQFVTFSEKRSWVRHDEHYHVDFTIPCEPL